MLEDEFLTDYAKKVLKQDNVYFIAGPSLATDLMKSTPIGFTISEDDHGILRNLFPEYIAIDNIYEPHLEFYSIYKNIIAIGSGIIYELTNSYSSVASYLTKAFQEIPNSKILYGTIGDYFMTGTSFNSRNFTFGTVIVKEKDQKENYLNNNTVEGYDMLKTLYNYLNSNHVNIRIIDILYSIIYKNEEARNLLFVLLVYYKWIIFHIVYII